MNERLKFLAITDSNLDEFLSVRFTDAYHNKDKSPYKDILASVIKFKQEQDNSFDKIKKEMSELCQQCDKWWKTLIASHGWDINPDTHWEVDCQENKVWIY